MNLLAFLWLIGCAAAVCIAFTIPEDVWSAVADRIRNPRPSATERIMTGWYSRYEPPADVVTEDDDEPECVCGHGYDEHNDVEYTTGLSEGGPGCDECHCAYYCPTSEDAETGGLS